MWVKLHDSWLDWEWHTDPNMVSLFFHLLSMASKKDTRFRGCEVKRGQVVVGRKMLSERTGISEQKIRTCLKRLERTGEISRKSTNKFTIITICNYHIYQPIFRESNQQSTSNQPATNQQLTTLIDNKNIDNISSTSTSARARLEEATINNSLWLDQTAMALRCPNVLELAVQCMDEWEVRQQNDERWDADHLVHHMRKKLDISKHQGKPTKAEAKEARRAELKRMSITDLNSMTNGNYQQQAERNGYNHQQ